MITKAKTVTTGTRDVGAIFAANVRRYREKQNWSAWQLADRITEFSARRVHPQTVYQWERETHFPSIRAVGEIARALEVEPHQLFK